MEFVMAVDNLVAAPEQLLNGGCGEICSFQGQEWTLNELINKLP